MSTTEHTLMSFCDLGQISRSQWHKEGTGHSNISHAFFAGQVPNQSSSNFVLIAFTLWTYMIMKMFMFSVTEC